MTIRAILFDLFDTLVYFGRNNAKAKCIRLAAQAGLSEEAWVTGWRSTMIAATRGEIATLEERVRLSLIAAGLAKPSENLVCSIAAARMLDVLDGPRLYPDVKECLCFLREQGFALALSSNIFPYEIEVIDRLGLRPLFDAHILSCEQGICKPAPVFFTLATGKLGVEPAECVFIGDGLSQELSAAKALGMTAVKINRDEQYNDDERDIVCDVQVQTLTEFLPWLHELIDKQKGMPA